MENLSNDFATTLSGSMDNVTTTANVASGAGAPAVNFRVKVDGELMLVTSLGTGLNWTVTRGIEGTAPASHSSAAPLSHVITKGGLDQYMLERGLVYEEQVVPAAMNRLLSAGQKMLLVGSLDVAGSFDCRGSVEVLH